jgi:hypothetical protein
MRARNEQLSPQSYSTKRPARLGKVLNSVMHMPDWHHLGPGCCMTRNIRLRFGHQHESSAASDCSLNALINLSNSANLTRQGDLTNGNGGCARTAFIERPSNSKSSCQIGRWLNDSHSTKCRGVHILIAKP